MGKSLFIQEISPADFTLKSCISFLARALGLRAEGESVYPDLPQGSFITSVWRSSVISRYPSWPVSLGLKNCRHINGGIFEEQVRSIAYGFLFTRVLFKNYCFCILLAVFSVVSNIFQVSRLLQGRHLQNARRIPSLSSLLLQTLTGTDVQGVCMGQEQTAVKLKLITRLAYSSPALFLARLSYQSTSSYRALPILRCHGLRFLARLLSSGEA